MTLDDLRPNPGAKKNKKRVGRGHGSGSGKTSGRGQKGQKARTHAGVGRGFEGGQLPIQKRMPYKRGFTNIFKTRWEVVNLETLAGLSVDGPVTPESLYAAGVTRGLRFPVKILGGGELGRKLAVHAHGFSASAKAAIEAAGGSVSTLVRDDEWAIKR
ncbi:MAG: 50S ribosomal protein L15, partial [Thermomicrobiales bacterium]